MDRLSRVMAVGSLALVLGSGLTASGCRSMRSEVPPGKPYSTTGGQPPTVGFSSAPHPNTGAGAGLYGNALNPGAYEPRWQSIFLRIERHDSKAWYAGSEPGQLWCTYPEQLRTGRVRWNRTLTRNSPQSAQVRVRSIQPNHQPCLV